MATVILFHSVYGLRSLEREAAKRLEAAGHIAVIPDLYDGRVATSIDEAFRLKDEIGWATICDRAERAIASLPPSTVVAGFSMGAAVAATLWPKRPQTAGVVFLHSVAQIAGNARNDLPVQVHLADPDPFEPAEDVAAWRSAAMQSVISPEVFTYPGVGHLYTDSTLPDYDADAAHLTWVRALNFLNDL